MVVTVSVSAYRTKVDSKDTVIKNAIFHNLNAIAIYHTICYFMRR